MVGGARDWLATQIALANFADMAGWAALALVALGCVARVLLGRPGRDLRATGAGLLALLRRQFGPHAAGNVVDEGRASMDLVVQASGLAKRYGDVVALRSLDLEVPRNSIFGFLGPNGAGKTTAMRLLLGLTAPTDGSAAVLGLDIVRDSVAIRRRVGYLPQQPRFYDDLSPRQTLRYARGFFPADPGRSVEAEIDEVLELVGLADKRDQPAGRLSGGQRQRLGIAQAQIHRPELLILDEPASALDPLGRRDVLDVMRRLKETTTVFYSTHILDDVQRVSDTVAILKAGERVAQAPVEHLLTSSGELRYDLTVRGDADAARERLLARPWVERVDAIAVDGVVELRVGVRDERLAERDLLRVVLADETIEVTRFTRARSGLEDVFVQLVDGGHP